MLTPEEKTTTSTTTKKKFSTRTFFKKPVRVNFVPPTRKMEVVRDSEHIREQLARKIRIIEDMKWDMQRLRKQVHTLQRNQKRYMLRPDVVPQKRQKSMCGQRKDWEKDCKRLAHYIENGGEKPETTTWPSDYGPMGLNDLVMNTRQPTAGAIVEGKKPIENRKWDEKWGPQSRLFLVCGTTPNRWHREYVRGACDELGIDEPNVNDGIEYV